MTFRLQKCCGQQIIAYQHHHCRGDYRARRGPADAGGGAGEQVGFARVITDRATFAWLADVFVLPAHRGRGLSKRLLAAILAHPDLQGLRRFMLATWDAHGLYQRFGFAEPARPDRLMERRREEAHQAGG